MPIVGGVALAGVFVMRKRNAADKQHLTAKTKWDAADLQNSRHGFTRRDGCCCYAGLVGFHESEDGYIKRIYILILHRIVQGHFVDMF
ncbi:hypothetical protein NIA69_20230 [Gemmiger formicilis]|nr:hypothetical protein [Gemmiger formicilis]